MIKVDYGYKAKPELKEYPDLWVKIGEKEYGLSIVTNVKSSIDSKLANQITKRHQYFLEQGMKPIWFIEKDEQSIEKSKNALVLWDAELSISSKTNEDKTWDSMLTELVKDKLFFSYFNYPISMDPATVDVRSMYYIYSNGDRIVVKVMRFLKDRVVKPYRAFLLNEGYELPFADALVVKNEFLLSQPKVEEESRKEFMKEFKQRQFQFQEKRRLQEEQRQLEATQREKLRQEMIEQEQALKKQLLQQMLAQKNQSSNQPTKSLTYSELKTLLRERIHLAQKEQMELWTRYMPQLGLGNSSRVWELVIENNCLSFNELRPILQNIIRKQYQS
jgi:hypothetical protein